MRVRIDTSALQVPRPAGFDGLDDRLHDAARSLRSTLEEVAALFGSWVTAVEEGNL